jgi:DNA-binding transcriptional LysR family regulator
MNLRQLECFRAVMVTGTMTRAAEVLRISQPSVSNIIAGLEHELGFSLFKRRKGRLQPTAEANYFFEEAQQTLESFGKAVQTAREIREMDVGRLVLATQPGIAIHFLPAVISEFLKDHPDVEFQLLSRSSQIVRDMIPTQRFDLAIAEPPVDHPAVKIEPLIADCVCVLPADHPLTAHEVITPELLDRVPFVSLYSEHATHYRLKNAFAEAGAHWKVVAETQYFATCCSFAQYGGGVSISDPYTASEYARLGVVVRPFRPVIPFEQAILYPVDRPRSNLLDAFVRILKDKLSLYRTTGPLAIEL